MIATTYTLNQLQELNFPVKTGPNTYYEGLEFKIRENCEDKQGIHYWMGFPSLLYTGPGASKEEDFRYIAIIDKDTTVARERWGDFEDPTTGFTNSRKYTAVKTPVQGLIELQVNPYDRKEIWLKYVEIHSEFRGQRCGMLNALLTELVNEMKRNGLTLSRSKPSEFAPSWLKPKMDKLLDDAGIPWKQGQ